MKRILVLVLATVLLLAACDGQAPVAASTATPEMTPTASPTPAPTPEPTAEPTPTPTVEPTPTPAPAQTSLTSGLITDKAYKPICITVENMPEARPQAGIGQADIVYESLMEGRSITRFLCVFNDTLPENFGPVRSCRIYFIDIAQEYKSLLAFYGGPGSTDADIYPQLKKSNIPFVVDGIGSKYDGYFHRIKERSAPHNVYTDLNKLSEIITEPIEPTGHFLFNADTVYGGDDVNSIEIEFTKTNVDSFYEYDDAAGNYKRSINGDPMIDANTNEQVRVKNIIVQYVKIGSYGTDRGHLKITMTGSGDADVFVSGKHVKATWKRDTIDDITRFYDKDGNEVALQPGNTWVELVPNTGKVPVIFK